MLCIWACRFTRSFWKKKETGDISTGSDLCCFLEQIRGSQRHRVRLGVVAEEAGMTAGVARGKWRALGAAVLPSVRARAREESPASPNSWSSHRRRYWTGAAGRSSSASYSHGTGGPRRRRPRPRWRSPRRRGCGRATRRRAPPPPPAPPLPPPRSSRRQHWPPPPSSGGRGEARAVCSANCARETKMMRRCRREGGREGGVGEEEEAGEGEGREGWGSRSSKWRR